ncbi:hypothetical protein Tmar_1494 [Thermaerobacter marianensis DSM 12885]|uniref:Permease for cytosine/purines uracil thiamine allantoin n=1 Tax=Thermaerobacter marianensis (strain ATCC 700841 / DSM 12885 / JCM 10246 / 7p75a) TaxID=644966 RepID=E6SGF5_THEM7|nr:hypothetical protein [Thermaerobacter marianensis]ADU51607.1 hypothetical protein Tmar_1494 [Thermaerobacter marianensis DSM 12885]
MGVRVSRWTLAYFAAALACFMLAQAAMALGWSYPVQGLFAPTTLAVVHLLTIGWLSLLILGALQQFVPVITRRSLASDAAAAWALGLMVAGLGGMVTGFLALPGGPLPPGGAAPAGEPAGALAVALPAGGALVLAGFTVAAVNLAVGLWCARPLVLPARFVAAGLAFLLVTGGLGVTLALILAHSAGAARYLPAPLTARLLGQGLPLHMAAGIGGWFTLTAMGVAYQLLSMFTLAPEERGATGRWVLRLAGGGLAAAWLGGLARLLLAGGTAAGAAAGAGFVPWVLQGLSWLATAGSVAAVAGVALYLADMARLYRQRRRPVLELNARYAPAALVALGLGLALTAAGAVTGRLAAWTPALVYLLLFGWLSGLGLTQLYKIVPFLTWLEKFGPRLGRGPAVRVQDLVDEPRAQPWFWLYFGAVAVGTAAALGGWQGPWRVATTLTLAATWGVSVELWRARHAEPKPWAGPVTPPWLGGAARAGTTRRATGMAQSGPVGNATGVTLRAASGTPPALARPVPPVRPANEPEAPSAQSARRAAAPEAGHTDPQGERDAAAMAKAGTTHAGPAGR